MPAVVVAVVAVRTPQAHQLVGLGLLEAEQPRSFSCAADEPHSVVRPMLEPGEVSQHGVATYVQPRVIDQSQPVLNLFCALHASLHVACGDRRPPREEPGRRLVPRPVQPVVQGAAACGELHRSSELALMGHDVGQVVAAARLQLDVARRFGDVGSHRDVSAGALEASCGGFDPRREQECRRPIPGLRRVVCRLEGAQDPFGASAVPEDDPGPAEPVADVEREQRIVHGAPRQRRVDVGALGPGEGQVLCLVPAANPFRRRPRMVREPCGVGGKGAVDEPGLGQGFQRERPDAVEKPIASRAHRLPRDGGVAGGGGAASSSTITRDRLANRLTTSIAAAGGTSSASRTNSTAGSGAPPAKVASAHRPRLSSGNSRS